MAQEQQQSVHLTIDGVEVQVPAGTTVLQAAATRGIRIPTLCYHPDLSLYGSCRVCLVEVEELGRYVTSCSTAVWEGMNVRTNSPAIRQARRDIVELLLDNHPMDCQTCERDGHCELQNLAYGLGVRERLFEGKRKHWPQEARGRSVIRDPDKCILCGRCVRVCSEVQGVYNLEQQGRGFNTVIAPAYGADMDDSVCIQCGQCINVCPVAAFLEQGDTDRVWAALADPTMHVVVQTAPSIRAAIGEGFGLEPGVPSTGKMVAALRKLGFDRVFDTDVGADVTIVEESRELTERLEAGGPLPMFTSCSPGWISFLEKFYPALIPHASSCRSPMSVVSALTKSWYAERAGLAPEKIFMVAVMPCVAKKFEARRPEHALPDGTPYTDAVLTTREAIWMIQSYGIDFGGLAPEDFDGPLGAATGAGDLFGITGGVMEASLRTAVQRLGGEPLDRIDFQEVRGVEGVKEAEVVVGDKTLRVGVANGLANARKLLEQVQRGERDYQLIEVMACPGGCSGGGGQPYPGPGYHVLDRRVLWRRGDALYDLDRERSVRRSHESPLIAQLYEEYLGEPGSERARALLHTSYAARLPRGMRDLLLDGHKPQTAEVGR